MAVVAAASLSSAFADSCATSFTGFYAGVQAGLNSTAVNVTITADRAGDDFLKRSAGQQAFIGGLFAGYGMSVGSCAYVGGEVYANFGRTNVNIHSTSNDKITMKNAYNLGAKVRLGYTVSPQAIIFLGLGLERAKWQVKEITTNNRLAANNGTFTKNKASFAFAPSVGLDLFLNKNLFLRTEFTYVFAPKMTINGDSSTPLVNAGQTVKFKGAQHRFALGLGYKF